MKEPAQLAYEAFSDHMEANGVDVPMWNRLPDHEREAWRAAAAVFTNNV